MFPRAVPERAVVAFWVNVVLCLVVAALLALAAVRTEKRSRGSAVALGFLAAFVLLLAFALFDAGLAFGAHGPALHSATVLLFLCAAADLIAGVIVAVSVLLFPRRS
jgi:phosphatidylglycerophosphate synthase